MNAKEEAPQITDVIEVASIPKPGNEPSAPPVSAEPSPYPEALTIALDQLARGLRTSGDESVGKMFAPNDAYPKAMAILEKLCKCALEWQELSRAHAKTQKTGGSAGISEETKRQFTINLEGPQTAT